MLEELRSCFFAEQERWILWLAPALGTGVAIYFALPEEPSFWIALPIWGCFFAFAFSLRRRQAWWPVFIGLSFLMLGFHVAQFRAWYVSAPVLVDDLGPFHLQARVVSAEPLTSGYRLLLDQAVVEGLDPSETPSRLRVSARALDLAPPPGSTFKGLVRLSPPPVPSAPGDYDFARTAWFQQLGGVGFVYGKPEIAPPAHEQTYLIGRWQGFWIGLRQVVSARILEILPGATGGVAVALITGMRGAVPAKELEEVRASGLAHLLAISGLHIGLITGILFVTIRAGFALWPAVALRYPIKEVAAVASLIGGGAYLLLAGAPVPTQRAFLMTALALLGVVVGRTAISLHSIAWAAIAVLIMIPESLLSASFQMSFGAVVGLVAAYEAQRRWREKRLVGVGQAPRPHWARCCRYLAGVTFTSLIATLAVAPMTLHHFSSLPLYSLLANLVAVPVTAFLVMPSALLALLAMPLEWEQPFFLAMGLGIDVVLFVAAVVAEQEGAVLLVPPMAPYGFPLAVLGGLWLCLWPRPWRLFGLIPIALGLASSTWTPLPDLVVSEDARLLAIRAENGQLLLNTRSVNRFSADQWLARAGKAKAALLPAPGDLEWPDLACDTFGCILNRQGREVAIAFEGKALEEDCRRADLVIALIPVPTGCSAGSFAPKQVIDSRDLRRQGGMTLRIESDGSFRIERVAQWRGNRLWSHSQGQ